MITGMVVVVCDEESHEGKVAIVGRLELTDAGGGRTMLTGGRDNLVDDAPVESVVLYGTLAEPPQRPELTRQVRHRHVLECDLCGLRLDLRDETANALAEKLLSGGVERITLAGLIRYSQ